MPKAKIGDTVKVHYTGTLTNGEEFDSSVNREPLEFTIGKGQLLKDFEQAVIGMSAGDSVKVNIAAKDGYGLRNDDLIGKFPIEKLPPDLKPEVGMRLQSQTEEGYAQSLIITEVSETEITLDANHELADKDLNFDIELVEII